MKYKKERREIWKNEAKFFKKQKLYMNNEQNFALNKMSISILNKYYLKYLTKKYSEPLKILINNERNISKKKRDKKD